jgi:hypothetical protein
MRLALVSSQPTSGTAALISVTLALISVTPAKAGAQLLRHTFMKRSLIPAFAGMTKFDAFAGVTIIMSRW